MSFTGYSGPNCAQSPGHSPQAGYGPPSAQYNQAANQHNQYPAQAAFSPQRTHPPQGYPPQQTYGAPLVGGYPPPHGGYGPPPDQWGPLPQQVYGQAPPHGQYGQALPPTPLYSGSFPPSQGYPTVGPPHTPEQAGYGALSSGHYPPQQQMSGYPSPPSPGYDPHAVSHIDMTATASEVRGAMKGLGTKDKVLIKAVANLNPLQITGLRHAYKSHVRRDLEKDITSETSGHYREGLLGIVRGPLLHDVYCVQKAIKGLGTNECMLNDVLLGRSNADTRAIKAAYHQTFGKDMVDDVADDLSFDTRRHFKMIMAATRTEESSLIFPQQLEQDVNTLHDATEGKSGTLELKVCEMFTNRSDGQIRAIVQQYEQRFQRSVDAVIRSEFSGHMKGALLLQLARATDKAMSDATQLEDAMKGAGTKDDLLVQRVVRVHWDRQHLEQVKGAYHQRFNTDLVERVKGETSGNYKELMKHCLA